MLTELSQNEFTLHKFLWQCSPLQTLFTYVQKGVRLFHLCFLGKSMNDNAISRRRSVQSKRRLTGESAPLHFTEWINIYNKSIFISILKEVIISRFYVLFSVTEFLHRFIQHWWWWWYWFPFCSRSGLNVKWLSFRKKTPNSSFPWTIWRKKTFVGVIMYVLYLHNIL